VGRFRSSGRSSDPSSSFTIDAKEVRIPFVYRWATYARHSAPKGATTISESSGGEAFELALVTPLSNVVSVRERTDDPRPGAPVTIAMAIGATVVGGALTAVGIYGISDSPRGGGFGVVGGTLGLCVGLPLAITGMIMTAVGAAEANAPVWDRTLYPARP
jgi:hypothetical protein